MHAIRFVAFADISPVGDVDTAIGAIKQIDATKPGIGCFEEIAHALADVRGSLAFEAFDIDASAVQVQCVKLVPITIGPVVAQVEHGAAVSMSAAHLISRADDIAGIGPAFARVKVIVVGGLIDQLVDEGIGIFTIESLEMCTGHGMPEMTDDGVGKEQLAVVVPVMAPRVRSADRHGLDDVLGRMESPNAAAHDDALLERRARSTDHTSGGVAAPTVEPAIGTPAQAVGEMMMDQELLIKPLEHDDRFAVRHV